MKHASTWLPFLLVLIAGAFFLAGMLAAPKKQTSAPAPPLSYDVPLTVVTKSVRAGDPFTTISSRCNSTGADLPVQATIWWQSSDGHLTPFLTSDGRGPRFDAVIPAGCRNDYSSTQTFPANIAPGQYVLSGQICYLNDKDQQVCSGWRTETFTVLP